MSKLALTWAALKGLLNPFGSVFDSLATYALERVNAALNAIDVGKREKIQAALNVAQKALASVERDVQVDRPSAEQDLQDVPGSVRRLRQRARMASERQGNGTEKRPQIPQARGGEPHLQRA